MGGYGEGVYYRIRTTDRDVIAAEVRTLRQLGINGLRNAPPFVLDMAARAEGFAKDFRRLRDIHAMGFPVARFDAKPGSRSRGRLPVCARRGRANEGEMEVVRDAKGGHDVFLAIQAPSQLFRSVGLSWLLVAIQIEMRPLLIADAHWPVHDCAMSDVTRILSQIESGDPRAAEKLLPLVYDELRKLAVAKLVQEKPGQTCMRLFSSRGVSEACAPRGESEK